MDVRKGPDRRLEDAAEFTSREQLRIDFRGKQIRITHWKLQHFLCAHQFTGPNLQNLILTFMI